MEKKIKISSNRSFGIVFFVVFLIVSFYPLYFDNSLNIWALIISIIFLILGLINSRILTPLNILWFKFGMFLGRIISPIIMGMVFFFVVTPTGLLMKLFNKDLLRLKKKDTKSYWITKSNEKSSMKNQF